MTFGGGQRYYVKMSKSRKTSYDLIVKPAVLTGFVTLKIRSVYSEHHNGFSMVRIWHAKHTSPKWKSNLKSQFLPSPLQNIGTWGPWELCPKDQMVVNWQIKWDKNTGITGN